MDPNAPTPAQEQTLLVMLQYTQETDASIAQVNASTQFVAHVDSYILGCCLVFGVLIASLLRPRNRG